MPLFQINPIITAFVILLRNRPKPFISKGLLNLLTIPNLALSTAHNSIAGFFVTHHNSNRQFGYDSIFEISKKQIRKPTI